MECGLAVFQDMNGLNAFINEPDFEKYNKGDFQEIEGVYLYNGKEILYEGEWTKTRYIEDAYKIGNISTETMMSIIDSFVE